MRMKMVQIWWMRGFIFLSLAMLAAVPGFAQDNPPSRAARLSYVQGKVSLQPTGANDWSEAPANYTVTTGDRIYTDQGSRAEVEAGPYAVRLSQGTDLTMANLNDQTMQLGLAQGSIRLSVIQLPSGQNVEVDTPNGALTINEPGAYRVDTDPNNGDTLVRVDDGSLQVTGGGANETIARGRSVELTGTGPIQITDVSYPRRDSFDQWSMSRDQRLRSARSRRYVNSYTPGYEDLDTYGRWRSEPDYGDVWYPTDVSASWAPYRDGRWVWIEPWGWTWVDDDPWGYTPFHYGRWRHTRYGWGWVPGPIDEDPVYAPALVAFVGGGGFSLGFGFGNLGAQAWFPLGPDEPYIPWYRHDGDYLRRVNISDVRNFTNITNITNESNINNIRYANRQIATTAVPAAVFQNGQSVRGRMVAPAQLAQFARAPVVARVTTSPAAQARVAGRPTAAPPVSARQMLGASAGAQKQLQNVGATRPKARAPQTSTYTPAQAPFRGRPGQAPQMNRNMPAQPQSARGGPPQTSRPRLITRMTPPPARTAPLPNRQPLPPTRSAQAPQPGRNAAPQRMTAGPSRTATPPLITRNAPGATRDVRMPPQTARANQPGRKPPAVTRNALPQMTAPQPQMSRNIPARQGAAPQQSQRTVRTYQPPVRQAPRAQQQIVTRSAPPPVRTYQAPQQHMQAHAQPAAPPQRAPQAMRQQTPPPQRQAPAPPQGGGGGKGQDKKH